MRWVWNTSCTTCALAASAASTSPRAYAERESTLPSSSHTASSGSSSAATAIGDRPQRPVLDFDQLGRGARGVAVAGDDEREHVAEVRRAPAFGDEHRPVLVDQADAQLARARRPR